MTTRIKTGDKKYYAAAGSITKNRFASAEISVIFCTVVEVKTVSGAERPQYVRIESDGGKQRFTTPSLLFDTKEGATDFLYYYLRLKALTNSFDMLRMAYDDQKRVSLKSDAAASTATSVTDCEKRRAARTNRTNKLNATI